MQVPFFRIRLQDAVRDPELYESFKLSAGKLLVFDAQPELCVSGTEDRSYQFPAHGPEIYAYDPFPMLPVRCIDAEVLEGYSEYTYAHTSDYLEIRLPETGEIIRLMSNASWEADSLF